jgi:hypothetical protein
MSRHYTRKKDILLLALPGKGNDKCKIPRDFSDPRVCHKTVRRVDWARPWRNQVQA